MNQTPDKCNHSFTQPRNRTFFCGLSPTLMIGLVGFSLLSALGCGETASQSDINSLGGENQYASPGSNDVTYQVQTPAEPQETDDGVLQKASDLFEKARSTSGNSASGASRWVQDKLGDAATASEQTAEESWKWATDSFESAKAQGLTTADSTSEWLGQDWKNMESWQYKITTLAGTEQELATQLNNLGKQGWECFNTEPHNEGTRFFFKKPSFSYLRNLPFKDFIKLVPLMTNGNK